MEIILPILALGINLYLLLLINKLLKATEKKVCYRKDELEKLKLEYVKWAPPTEEMQKWTPFEDLPERVGTTLIFHGYSIKQDVLNASDEELAEIGFVSGEIAKIREDLS